MLSLQYLWLNYAKPLWADTSLAMSTSQNQTPPIGAPALVTEYWASFWFEDLLFQLVFILIFILLTATRSYYSLSGYIVLYALAQALYLGHHQAELLGLILLISELAAAVFIFFVVVSHRLYFLTKGKIRVAAAAVGVPVVLYYYCTGGVRNLVYINWYELLLSTQNDMQYLYTVFYKEYTPLLVFVALLLYVCTLLLIVAIDAIFTKFIFKNKQVRRSPLPRVVKASQSNLKQPKIHFMHRHHNGL